MSTENVDIVVSETGADKAKASIGGIGDGADKATASIGGMTEATNLLKEALVTLGLAFSVEKLIEISNGYVQLQNQLTLVTHNTQELADTQAKLLEISNDTRQGMEGTVSLYSGLAIATKNLNVSQDELFSVVTTINQAMTISGKSADEVSGAMRRFSASLSQGTLDSRGITTVLLQFPALARAIANGLNIDVGALRTMAAAGQITSQQIVKALGTSAGQVDALFKQMTPTIAQAFVVLKNNVEEMIGEFITAEGAGSGLANAILFLANNLGTFVKMVSIAAAAYAAYRAVLIVNELVALAAAAGAVTASMGIMATTTGVLTFAIGAARTAVIGLWTLLVANPIGAIVIAIAAAGVAVYEFGNSVKLTSDGSITLLGAVKGSWVLITEAVSFLYNDLMVPFYNWIASTFGPAWAVVKDGALYAINAVSAGLQTVLRFLGQFFDVFKSLDGVLSHFATHVVDVMKKASSATDDASHSVKKLGDNFKITALDGNGAMSSLKAGALEASQGTETAFNPVKGYIANPYKDGTDDSIAALKALRAEMDGTAYAAKNDFSAVGDAATSAAKQISSSGSGAGGGSAGSGGSSASSGSHGGSFTTTFFPDVGYYYKMFINKGFSSNEADALSTLSLASYYYGTGQDVVGRGYIAQAEAKGATPDLVQKSGIDFWGIKGVDGFATGGSFMVGGSGGQDSQLVQFLASPDERVTVQTPSQQRAASTPGQAGPSTIVYMTVTGVPDAASFNRSKTQVVSQLSSELQRIGRMQTMIRSN